MVMVPISKHKDQECVKAKETELEKLQNSNTYVLIVDDGQFRLSTRWVLWYKDSQPEVLKKRLLCQEYLLQLVKERSRSSLLSLQVSAMK